MIDMTSDAKLSKEFLYLNPKDGGCLNKTQRDDFNVEVNCDAISNVNSDDKHRHVLKFFGIMLMLFIALLCCTPRAYAAIEVYEFDNARQEAQYKALIEEFRCPKCQNQNLAGSDSQISKDLKRKTYELVMAGQSDAEIREYMYDRYGDFISYKPPVRPSTWILWYFPPIVLSLLLIWWIFRTHAKSQKKVAMANHVSGDSLITEDVYHNNSNLKQDSESISISSVAANAKASSTPNNEDSVPDTSQDAYLDINQNNTQDSVGENLSTQEADRLKALLEKYDNDDQHSK